MKLLNLDQVHQVCGGQLLERPPGISCQCWIATEIVVALTYHDFIDHETGYLITDVYCTSYEYQTMYETLLANINA